MANPKCRNYMLDNLKIEGDPGEKATEEQAIEAVVDILEEIGFILGPTTEISLKNYGIMPDDESESNRRYYVEFEVDIETADNIYDQRHGRRARIREMNEAFLGSEKNKYLKLRKLKSVHQEAIDLTMKNTMIILSKEFPKNDGFSFTLSGSVIQILFDDEVSENWNIETIIRDHINIFDKVIKTLPASFRQYMVHLAEHVQRRFKKRSNDNDESFFSDIRPEKVRRFDEEPTFSQLSDHFPPMSPIILPNGDNEVSPDAKGSE